MNKLKKLLSVVLAVVLAFSALTVLGSAAKANYKTVAELEALDAFSPYGQVTRLSTEERTSVIFDALDTMLLQANINPGQLFSMMGLSLTVDLRSINALCGTLDNVKSLLGNWLVGIAGGLLGLVGDLNFDNWDSGMTRENTDQLYIISELLTVLGDNSGVVYNVISTGTIDLGLASSALGDLDLSIIADLPGLIKGMVFPMLERWDDTLAEIKTLDTNAKGNGNVETTVNTYVKGLFNNDMSMTTVKYDVNGTMTSEHTKMPFQTSAPGAPTDSSPRMVYVVNGTTPGSTLTIYHIVDEAEAKALAEDTDAENDAAVYTYVAEETTYTLEEEAGNGVYVWKAKDNAGNVTATLKWYNDNSPFLPGISGDDIDLTAMSVGDLLYTFIPVVFEQMAPVVLNGSVKKILAEFFGAKFTYVGEGGPEADAAVLALPDASNAFFTEEQGEYLWEWSNYAVINGNHYYRFENQIYKSDLSAVNNYFDIINWNYEITGDFMNEFIPANDDNASNRLLLNLNNFLIKVAETVLVESAETDNSLYELDATWTRPAFVKGDNSNLVNNIKMLAQAIVGLAPAHIFGSDYAENERSYVELMLSEDNDTVLVGIAAHLVNMIMPSMSLPGKSQILASNAKVGAILAAVVREFAAYLVPEYNYDALIYADFGTTTADPNKTFVDPEAAGLVTEGQTVSGYWLDVILTMGMDIGYEYIRAFADMGEDTTEWSSFVTYSGYGVDGKTYAAGTTQAQLNAQWEGMLDYVVDWALDKDYEWTWKMENLVNTTGLTIDLATAQDPWVKLDLILDTLLPVDELLTVEGEEEMGITELEKLLRYDLILGLVDLKWDNLINTLQFNGTNKYFRTANVLDQLAKLLKGVINGLFAKIGGGSYALLPSGMTDFDSLANQANIATLARDLIGALSTAYANGLFDTVFPILNFFIGWKSDPQVIAEPIISYSFRDGNDYAYQWTGQSGYPAIDGESTKITFLNNSSGMLEKHRDTTVVDHEYAIQIKSVTPDAGAKNAYTITYSDGNGYVSPYETVEIKIGGTYSVEEAVTFTIAYDYIGKDGNAVGGTQYVSRTYLISNQYEDANIEGRESGDESDGNYGIDPFKKYQFTEDIYTTVTTFQPAVFGDNGTFSGTSNWHHTNAPDPVTRDCDGNITDSSSAIGMTGNAAKYFDYYQNRDGGWASSFPKDGSTSGKLYYAKDGVTAETEFPYGVYDMGQVGIKYSDDTKVWNIDYIYYNDYDIYDIYTANMDNGYTADMVGDAAVYNEYNAAWKDIVKYATYPMMTEANGNAATDYVKTIQPYIPAAIERFEAALEAFQDAKAEAEASGSAAALPEYVQKLEAQLALDDGNGEKEVNFQDYEYYEYFNYADLRTAHRDFVKTYYAPEIMDTYYIQGSGIREAELNNVIAAEDNAAIAAGITASRMENDAQAIADSITANNEWQMPFNQKLFVDDMTARLAYYKTFLTGKEEPASHLQFLNLEIAHVEAQQLVEEDYEANSWARYAEALAEAKAVAAGTAEYASYNSTIYSAKYDLMVAYKNLLLKADSLIEAGGTAELAANAVIAEEIFASLDAGDGAWAVKEGVDANTAYAALISALGYYYVGEDGVTYNLYADSAYEYLDNDRPNRQSNQAKVNVSNNALAAAIANFEAAAPEMEPSTLMVQDDFEYADYVVIDTANNNYEEYTGIVYGIDTLDQNEMMEVLGSLDDALTTNNGDDFLVIEANENGGVESTGATITVVDENGDALETYVFVYFGDIDGDAMISANDALIAEYYEATYEGINSYAEYVSADVDGDGMPSANDALIMEYYEATYEGVDYQYNLGQNAMNNTYEWIF